MLPKTLLFVVFVSAITICGGAERKIRRTQKVLKHAKNNVANNNKHSADIPVTGLKQESQDKLKRFGQLDCLVEEASKPRLVR